MANTKDQFIRYRVINRMVRDRSNPYPSKMELLEECKRALGVDDLSDRILDYDIENLRYNDKLGYYAPLKYCKSHKGYYYTEEDYSLDNMPLNAEDLESVLFAARMFEQFREIDIFGRFLDTANKLRSAVKVYRYLDTSDWASLIDFEKGEENINSDHWDVILDALREKHPLRITYKKFSQSQAKSYIVHPYLLKEYRNRWYLVGLSQEPNAIRSFGLDRIEKVERVVSAQFMTHPFKRENYYKHVIGITVENGVPVDIKIAFSEFQAQFVITQPLHHSQKELSDEGGRRIFSYKLIPNFEFYAHILSWGKEVEVLEPAEVRNKVLELAEGIVGRYRD